MSGFFVWDYKSPIGVLNVQVSFSVISPLLVFCWCIQALPLALHTVYSQLVC